VALSSEDESVGSTRGGRILFACALLVLGSASACTLVSGWSDLQDGADRGTDASADRSDAGGMEDASAHGDAEAGTATRPALACGATACEDPNTGCCAFAVEATCMPSRDGCKDGLTWITCDGPASCTDPNEPICCNDVFADLVHCVAVCDKPEQFVVCDPKAPVCPQGKSCSDTSASGAQFLHECR
jgi:hypothetical protein